MRVIRAALVAVIAFALIVVSPASAQTSQPVNPVGAAVLAFQEQVAAYVKIHNQAESQVPQLRETTDPVKIAERERALGLAIQKLRPHAKAGDVFVAQYQPYLIKTIKEDFAKRSAADRKALVVELPKDVKVGVNQIYPTTLPLETFPPKLLRVLPDLPPELEYRIVGRSLILRDVKANLVVDVLKDVVPTIPS
jgi:hypothetical protein